AQEADAPPWQLAGKGGCEAHHLSNSGRNPVFVRVLPSSFGGTIVAEAKLAKDAWNFRVPSGVDLGRTRRRSGNAAIAGKNLRSSSSLPRAGLDPDGGAGVISRDLLYPLFRPRHYRSGGS